MDIAEHYAHPLPPVLENSGIRLKRIVDDPDDMIVSLGIAHQDTLGAADLSFLTTNLDLAEAKFVRDWLSLRIAEAERGA